MILVLETSGLCVCCQVQASPCECLVLDHTNFAGIVGFFYHSNILGMRMLMKYLLTHQIVGCEIAIRS